MTVDILDRARLDCAVLNGRSSPRCRCSAVVVLATRRLGGMTGGEAGGAAASSVVVVFGLPPSVDTWLEAVLSDAPVLIDCDEG